MWLVFSGGLRVYLQLAQTGDAAFGALGGVLIVLLWVWLVSLAVLIGGEINQLRLESARPGSAGGSSADDGGVGERTDAPAGATESARPGSAGVEGGAELGDEGTSFDGGATVEDDPHDGRRDDDAVGRR